MALIGAAGVVARGDDGSVAEQAVLYLRHAEALVGEVALAVARQPGSLGEDETERADGGEITGEQCLECTGVAVPLGGGPFGEE